MRIVSGEFKGRRFSPPAAKYPTRPTTDTVRESLFNILTNTIDFEEITMLDLFGGFGMNGIEAISRGCQSVHYVERHRGCVEFVRGLANTLDIEDKLNIISQDAFKFISQTQEQFDLVFVDPPYLHPKLKSLPKLILESGILKEKAWLIVEHDNTVDFASHNKYIQSKKYGQSILSFFQ